MVLKCNIRNIKTSLKIIAVVVLLLLNLQLLAQVDTLKHKINIVNVNTTGDTTGNSANALNGAIRLKEIPDEITICAYNPYNINSFYLKLCL